MYDLKKLFVLLCAMMMSQPLLVLTAAPLTEGQDLVTGPWVQEEAVYRSEEGITVLEKEPCSLDIVMDDLTPSIETLTLALGPGKDDTVRGTRVLLKDRPADMAFTSDPGLPPLPQRRILIAVPPGTLPFITEVDHFTRDHELSSPLIADPDVPIGTDPYTDNYNDGDGGTGAHHPLFVDGSRLDSPYPEEVVTVTKVGSAGGLRMAHVLVTPVRAVSPTSLQVSTDIGFKVEFRKVDGAGTGGIGSDPGRLSPLGETVGQMVLNPWHVPPRGPTGNAATAAFPDLSGRAGNTDVPLYKLTIPPGGGIIKVTGAELTAAGADIGSIDPSTIKVLFASEERLPTDRIVGPRPLDEVPCIVEDGGDSSFDSGDGVIFYALSPDRWDPMSEDYIDNLFTDEYVYWITWMYEDGQRMIRWDASGSASDPAEPFNHTSHFEEDLIYNMVVNNDDRVDGYTINRMMWGTVLATSAPYGSRVAIVTEAGNPSWTDYWVEATVRRLNDPGFAYLMFRVSGPRDYYVFEFGGGAYRIIESSPSSVRSTLASVDSSVYPMSTNVEYRIRVEVNGGNIDCYVDGNPVVSTTDGTPKASGNIGFNMNWWQRWEFDDVEVRDLSNTLLFSDDFESYGIGDRASPTWTRVHMPYNHTSPLVGNWSRMTVRDRSGDKVLKSHTDSLDLHFEVKDVDQAQDAFLKLQLTGSKEDGKTVSRVLAYLNGNPVADETWDTSVNVPRRTSHTGEVVFPGAYLNEGDNVLRLDLPGTGGSTWQEVFIDWFEVSYWRDPAVDDGQLLATHDPTVHGNHVRIATQGTTGAYVLNVTNPNNPTMAVNIATIGNDLMVPMTGVGKAVLAVTDAGGILSPVAITPMPRPDWMAYPDAAPPTDEPLYVIITHPDLMVAANNLSVYREGRGWNVMVVDVDVIYDVFNGGIEDEAALRNFLAYLYNRPDMGLSHVLLLGGSEFVPTHYSSHDFFWQEIASDWYFSLMDDDDGDDDVDDDEDTPDIVVARVGVKTNDEMNQLMKKVVSYEAVVDQPWHRKVFLTEGFESSQSHWIGDSFNIINNTYLAPNNIEVNMMFRHLLPGESTNLAKRYNRENISDGRWITNYAGHGGRGNWQTLDKEDLRLLTNADALTIDLNFACDTGWLDDPTYNSLIEDFTLIADKGAVAGLGASRSSTASDYNQVQISFYEAVFTTNAGDLGTMITVTKTLNNVHGLKNELYILNTDPAVEVVGVQDATIIHAGLAPVGASHTRLESGDQGQIWVEVLNRGRAGTSSPVSLHVELEDPSGDPVESHDLSVGVVAARQKVRVETDITTQDLPAGIYTIKATISLTAPDQELSVLNQEMEFTAAIVEPPVGDHIDDTDVHSHVHLADHVATYMDTAGNTWAFDIHTNTSEKVADPFTVPGSPTVLVDRVRDHVLYQHGSGDVSVLDLGTGQRDLLAPFDLVGVPCIGKDHAAFVQKDPRGYRAVVVNLTDGGTDTVLLQQYQQPLLACLDRHIVYTEEVPLTFALKVTSRAISDTGLGPATPVTSASTYVVALAGEGNMTVWANEDGIDSKDLGTGSSLKISNDGARAMAVKGIAISEDAVSWIDGTDLSLSGTTNLSVFFLGNSSTYRPADLNSRQGHHDQDGETLVMVDDRERAIDRRVVVIPLVERHELGFEVSTSRTKLSPGGAEVVNLSVSNVGNRLEQLTIDVTVVGPDGLNTSLGDMATISSLFPGEVGNLTLDVQVSTLVLTNESWNVTLHLHSSTSTAEAYQWVDVNVDEVFDMSVEMNETQLYFYPGETVVVPMVLVNQGNGLKTVELNSSVATGWVLNHTTSVDVVPGSGTWANITVSAPLYEAFPETVLVVNITVDIAEADELNLTWGFARPLTAVFMKATMPGGIDIAPGSNGTLEVNVPNTYDLAYSTEMEVTGLDEFAYIIEDAVVTPFQNGTGLITVTIPKGTPPGSHSISVTVSSHYGTVYLESFVNVPKVVDIVLEAEDARVGAGNETSIPVTIRNHGNDYEKVDLVVEEGSEPYEGWAAVLLRLSFSLNTGDVQSTTLKVTPSQDANGTYDLTLVATCEGIEVANATVTITVEPIVEPVPPPPPPPPPPDPPPEPVAILSALMIGVIAGVIAFILVAVLLFFILSRSRKKDEPPEQLQGQMVQQQQPPPPPPPPDGFEAQQYGTEPTTEAPPVEGPPLPRSEQMAEGQQEGYEEEGYGPEPVLEEGQPEAVPETETGPEIIPETDPTVPDDPIEPSPEANGPEAMGPEEQVERPEEDPGQDG